MSEPLQVFVASSSERIDIAVEVAKKLASAGRTAGDKGPTIAARPWTNGTFSFSRTYIESLEHELDHADFAVVIYVGDDAAQLREQRVNLPRDNVVFELGLFIGRLGRERCFFFIDRASPTHIASDLSGVKEVAFDSTRGGTSSNHLGLAHACRMVARQMREIGARFKPDPDTRRRQQDAWRFIGETAGYWWSLQHWARDGIGFVRLTPDRLGPSLAVQGDVFAPAAPSQPAAWWRSTTSVLVDGGAQWNLRFTWEGTVPGSQRFEGVSRYLFKTDEHPPMSGHGEIIETDIERYSSRPKEASLKRCSEEETEIMLGHDNQAKRVAIERQLSQWIGA
ncbi:nucleotide-binding protein [Thauera sp. WH-1]|uniref:nucleotide-binding protein n=1 Tax=Thauera sp. WH-1 TaxID=3398230 RepID=UPI0039FC0442